MVSTTVPEALEACLDALQRHGLLLQQDQRLPSLVGIIAGGPLRGSWWGHPTGASIYHTIQALEDHPDVLETKLVAGKVTYVHRRLWPAAVSVGSSRAGWQLEALSPAAVWLLDYVTQDGELQLNDLPLPAGLNPKDLPAGARQIERRLLARGLSVHTPSGAHAKCLESWDHWQQRTSLAGRRPPLGEAQRHLEQAAETLAPGAAGLLPWRTPPAKRR